MNFNFSEKSIKIAISTTLLYIVLTAVCGVVTRIIFAILPILKILGFALSAVILVASYYISCKYILKIRYNDLTQMLVIALIAGVLISLLSNIIPFLGLLSSIVYPVVVILFTHQ